MKKLLLTFTVLFFTTSGYCADLPVTRAKQIRTDTTNFDNNLSTSDTTVQKALDTLDDMVGAGTGAGTGDVVGPASSVDNAVSRFNGTTGKTIQNSGVYIDDSGNLGIGISDPTNKLHIIGNLLATSATLTTLIATSTVSPGLDVTTMEVDYALIKDGLITADSGIFTTLNFTNASITTTIGNIPAGTWNGDVIAITKGGTALSTTPASGKLLIGKADGSYALATITAGANIGITNGDGVITICSTGAGVGDMTKAVYDVGEDNIIDTEAGGTGTGTTPTSGQLLIGQSGGTWTLATLTGGRGIDISNATGAITVQTGKTGVFDNLQIGGDSTFKNITAGTWSGDTVLANKGGTGTATTPTSGQLLIGKNTGDYNISTLTAGAGIGITNATAGTITINTSGSGRFSTLILAGTDISNRMDAGSGTFGGLDITTGEADYFNIKDGLVVADTGTFTNLVATTMKSGDTRRLMSLVVKQVEAGTLTANGVTLSIQENFIFDKLVAQTANKNAATDVVFTLREMSSDGTTPMYDLKVGQTATTAPLNVTSFTGNSCPAGNLIAIDILSVHGGATNPDFKLEVFGHSY